MSEAKELIAALFFAFIGFVIATLVFLGRSETHYRQGQIDYANGIIKYQLQQTPTGETVWKKASE